VRSLRLQTQRHCMRSVTIGSIIAEAAEQAAHSKYLDLKLPRRASYAPAIRRSPSNPIDTEPRRLLGTLSDEYFALL
jgi:hypothetical protein